MHGDTSHGNNILREIALFTKTKKKKKTPKNARA